MAWQVPNAKQFINIGLVAANIIFGGVVKTYGKSKPALIQEQPQAQWPETMLAFLYFNHFQDLGLLFLKLDAITTIKTPKPIAINGKRYLPNSDSNSMCKRLSVKK
jgi:hypothetical protein